MKLNFAYFKKFSPSFMFLFLLYCGIGTIIYYDFVYSKTPIDVIKDSIEYEQSMEQHQNVATDIN